MRVTGKRRKGRPLRVVGRARRTSARASRASASTTATARDGAQAVIDYGRRIRPGREAVTRYAYARRGRYNVIARVTDVAGHLTTATLPLRIRK